LFELIRENPDAKLVAGATELGLKITKDFLRFPALISLEAIPELQALEATEEQWRIGGAVTLTRVWDAAGGEFPALATMLRWFGSRQIRNRATIGGNLVTGSPIGDSAPVLLALDAEVVLVSSDGERRLPLTEFFLDYRKTALRKGEILRTVVIPRSRPLRLIRHCQFYKVSRRREMDISTVSGCFRVDLDEAGIVKNARIAYGGVARIPRRARTVEESLVGRLWTGETVASIRPLLTGSFSPISDVRGSASYRHALVVQLLEKFFEDTRSGLQSSFEGSALPLKVRPENRSLPHESAKGHVSGAAIYVDDRSAGREILEVWPVCSPHAHARVLSRDIAEARKVRGIADVLLAEDIPGSNDTGAVRHDEPLLARDKVNYAGQIVALVVGETQEDCRKAAELVRIEYEPLAPILTIREAIAGNSFHTEPNFIRRGDVENALAEAPLRLSG
jgi:CO/xanthine dehydrogenase FAD-binding subunit